MGIYSGHHEKVKSSSFSRHDAMQKRLLKYSDKEHINICFRKVARPTVKVLKAGPEGRPKIPSHGTAIVLFWYKGPEEGLSGFVSRIARFFLSRVRTKVACMKFKGVTAN